MRIDDCDSQRNVKASNLSSRAVEKKLFKASFGRDTVLFTKKFENFESILISWVWNAEVGL